MRQYSLNKLSLENIIVMLNKTIKNYNLIKLTKLKFKVEIFSFVTEIIQGAVQNSNLCLMTYLALMKKLSRISMSQTTLYVDNQSPIRLNKALQCVV